MLETEAGTCVSIAETVSGRRNFSVLLLLYCWKSHPSRRGALSHFRRSLHSEAAYRKSSGDMNDLAIAYFVDADVTGTEEKVSNI